MVLNGLKNKLNSKIRYYLQYLGSNFSPLNSQKKKKKVFVVVNVAHSQQVVIAGSKHQGFTNKWNASVHIDCIM